jgi:hypothetical protein
VFDWDSERGDSECCGEVGAVSEDLDRVSISTNCWSDQVYGEAEALDEARHAEARRRRLAKGTASTQTPQRKHKSDIADDWVIVDVTEREGDLLGCAVPQEEGGDDDDEGGFNASPRDGDSGERMGYDSTSTVRVTHSPCPHSPC